jgi:hypothetical protein
MKADRKLIFDKYGGKCAYCGCELQKGWHIDEVEPVRRKWKTIPGHWSKGYVKGMTEEQMGLASIKWIAQRNVLNGEIHPERFNIDNQNPACASCNINKHSMSLEEFRALISGFVVSLNRDSTQYKIAKRYGLIDETGLSVRFYFEYHQNINHE